MKVNDRFIKCDDDITGLDFLNESFTNMDKIMDAHPELFDDHIEEDMIEESFEGKFCIVAITRDGQRKFYSDGIFVDNYKEATIFTDMDEAREVWYNIDKKEFKRVFIPNYDESAFEQHSGDRKIEPAVNENLSSSRYKDEYISKYGSTVRFKGHDCEVEDVEYDDKYGYDVLVKNPTWKWDTDDARFEYIWIGDPNDESIKELYR